MNYNDACTILNLNSSASITEIKKQYKLLALKYHPDKNPNNKQEAEEKFKKISEAYIYLTDHENDKDNKLDNENYNNIYQSFLKSVFSNIPNSEVIINFLTNINIGSIKTISKPILEKFSSLQLTQIYEFLQQYGSLLYLDETYIQELKQTILELIENNDIFILTPSLEDLFLSKIYVLKYEEEVFYIPLWHSELYFETKNEKNIIIKCIPKLDDHIHIEENNDIHIYITTEMNNLWEKKTLEIKLGEKIISIDSSNLYIKQYQTYILYDKGINTINTKKVYDDSKQSNIYVHIHLK